MRCRRQITIINTQLSMMAKRVDNFTLEEKTVLTDIIKNYDVVESKAYSRDVLEKKKRAWQKITDELNSSFPQKPPRDTKSIQGVWRRIKISTKETVDMKKKLNKGTGGGPPAVPYTVVEENVIAVLGDSAEPCQNEFDDEGQYVKMFSLHNATIDIPMVLEEAVAPNNSPNEDTTSSTPRAKKKKRCHAANDVEEMMMEVHQRQLYLLKLQEEKAILDIDTAKMKNKKAKLDMYTSLSRMF